MTAVVPGKQTAAQAWVVVWKVRVLAPLRMWHVHTVCVPALWQLLQYLPGTPMCLHDAAELQALPHPVCTHGAHCSVTRRTLAVWPLVLIKLRM